MKKGYIEASHFIIIYAINLQYAANHIKKI